MIKVVKLYGLMINEGEYDRPLMYDGGIVDGSIIGKGTTYTDDKGK